MFKVTSRQRGTYYCGTLAQAQELKALRKRNYDETYRIVELPRSTDEQRKRDHMLAFTA